MAAALPLIGSILGGIMGGGNEEPSAPALPPPVEAEPEGALDQESVRLRALRRKKSLEEDQNLTGLADDTGTSTIKTLLGE